MSTLFGSLGVARSALLANQLAIQTSSHNIANSGRAGYTRQRVELAAGYPETLAVGQVGTGVTVEGIRRLRDQFLDQQFYRAQQTLGDEQARQNTLLRVESLLGEPSDTGLQSSLSSFFTALHDLASYPEDLTTRRAVLEQAEILAGDLNRLRSDLATVERDVEAEITQRVADANDLIAEIAALNNQIQTVTVAGGSPNDLRDRRSEALDALAELVGITVLEQPSGAVHVGLTGGGGMLVSGTVAQPLQVAPISPMADVRIELAGLPVTVQGGRMAGLLAARNDPNESVKRVEAELDELAAALIRGMNHLQATGAGSAGLREATSQWAVSDAATPLGSAGIPFPVTAGQVTVFTYDAGGAVTGQGQVAVTATTTLADVAAQFGGIPGLTAEVTGGRLTVRAAAGTTFRMAEDTGQLLTGLGVNGFFTGTDAGTIAVDPGVMADPRLLSTGQVDLATGIAGSGDNRAVLAMAALSERKLLVGGTATPSDFYAATVGVVGARAAAANREVEGQLLVTQAVESQRQQVSGVSLDEEMAGLIQTQRAFQASARMISVVDELLDLVVNGLVQ
jgi:flagellar hook-associated protein 1 FlgK